jgi:alkylhydroperoxidase family enzyme
VLDDFESAHIDEKLKATLRFLRKMTLDPEALTAGDARAVLATGVDREALTHAIHVAYLFNIYDRLADAMGWDVPDQALGSYQAGAQRLLKRGYGG